MSKLMVQASAQRVCKVQVACQFSGPAKPAPRKNQAYQYDFIASKVGRQPRLDPSQVDDYGEPFRAIRIRPPPMPKFRRPKRKPAPSEPAVAREALMSPTQDWPSVWPTAATFKASAVPLPLRMGYSKSKNRDPTKKYGHLEFMKIPNFLHLTPEHIRRQCEALKKYCVPVPKPLKNLLLRERAFPIEYETADFTKSSTSIRHDKARFVDLRVKLSSLQLSQKEEDKIIRICKTRYNYETDEIMIHARQCPLRDQNLDYAKYILCLLYMEARVKDVTNSLYGDLFNYEWKNSQSESLLVKNLRGISGAMKGLNRQALKSHELVVDYGLRWERMRNERVETNEICQAYGMSFRKLLNLPQPLQIPESLKAPRPETTSIQEREGTKDDEKEAEGLLSEEEKAGAVDLSDLLYSPKENPLDLEKQSQMHREQKALDDARDAGAEKKRVLEKKNVSFDRQAIAEVYEE